MGNMNFCHNCGEQIPREHQVTRYVGYCHHCGSLTNLKSGEAFKGRVTLKPTRQWLMNRKITYLARVCGQVAFMPNP